MQKVGEHWVKMTLIYDQRAVSEHLRLQQEDVVQPQRLHLNPPNNPSH